MALIKVKNAADRLQIRILNLDSASRTMEGSSIFLLDHPTIAEGVLSKDDYVKFQILTKFQRYENIHKIASKNLYPIIGRMV